MNKNKLFFTLLIAVILCLTINVKAISIATDSAKKGTTDTNSYLITNTGTLTVTNTDDDLLAYKILDAYYNATSNSITYEFTSEFKIFLNQSSDYKNLTIEKYYSLTSGNITSGETQTNSTLDKLVSTYATYIRNNLSQNGISLTRIGTTASKELSVGSYLVLKNNSTLSPRLLAVMVGNIELTGNNDTWEIKEPTIVAKKTNNAMHVFVASEISKPPSIFINGDVMSMSSFIGNTIEGITAVTIPIYPTNATNKLYKLDVSFETGFFIPTSGIGIRNYINDLDKENMEKAGKKVVDYKLQFYYDEDPSTGEENCNYFVNDPDSGIIAKFNRYSGTHGEIVPDFTYINENLIKENTMNYYIYAGFYLDNNFKLGTAGNTITVTLTYATDPYGTETTTESETLTIYTYGGKLTVTDEDDSSIKLSNAEFEVYADSALTTKLGSSTTNDNGEITIYGIASGTYYIKQTKTKAGYKMIEPFSIEVSDAKVEEDGYVYVSISLPKSTLLPFTGGVGNIIYTAIGLIVITSSVAIFILYKKGYNKEI